MEIDSIAPSPNTSRRRGFLRQHPARVIAFLCLLGCASLLWQSSDSDSDSAGDRSRSRRGLRNALTSAAKSSPSFQRRLGSAKASASEPLLPPHNPSPGILEKLSGMHRLSEDWVLSSDTAQQLGFSEQKTKELNEFLALMRGRICEEQTSRMKMTITENGDTLIRIPVFDGSELRGKLELGIIAIAGTRHMTAAAKLCASALARADADFAGIGQSSMELQFANTGTESAPRYRVMRTVTHDLDKSPVRPPLLQYPPPLLPVAGTLEDAVSVQSSVTDSIHQETGAAVTVTVVSTTTTSESSAIPARYAHLFISSP